MNIQLVALGAKNLRCFKESTWVPIHERLTVIVGRNNAGKSSLLSIPPLVVNTWLSFLGGGTNWLDGMQFEALARHSEARELGDKRNLAASVLLRMHVMSFNQLVGKTTPTNWVEELEVAQHVRQHALVKLGTIEPFAKAVTGKVEFLCEIGFKVQPRLFAQGLQRDTELFVRIYPTLELPTASTPYIGFVKSLHGGTAFEYRKDEKEGVRKTGSDELITQVVSLGVAHKLARHFALWASQPLLKGGSWGQNDKRHDSNSNGVIAVIDYLKNVQDRGFRVVSREVMSAFPEFAGVHLHKRNSVPEPVFELSYLKDPITEETRPSQQAVGSGVWAFLSLLSCTNVASITGAKAMLLDEPQIHLHPELERKLVEALLRTAEGVAPGMQFVITTHSAAFVDAAWRDGFVHVLHWNEESASVSLEADVRHRVKGSITESEVIRDVWRAVGVHPSEFLFSDRVCFVEGPSDSRTIRVLASGLGWKIGAIYFSELSETDVVTGRSGDALLRAIPSLVLSQKGLMRSAPLLLLDSDKESDARDSWGRVAGASDPMQTMNVHFCGDKDGDFEDYFWSKEFLIEYISQVRRGLDDSLVPSKEEIGQQFDELSADSALKKGTDRFDKLLFKTLAIQYKDKKTAILPAIAEFCVEKRGERWCAPVLTNLERLRTFMESPEHKPWVWRTVG